MKIPSKGDRILPSCQGLRMGAIVHPESASDQANTEAKTAAAAALPDAKQAATSPPSKAARHSSKEALLGLLPRVYWYPLA